MQFLKPYTECIHDTVRIVAGVLFFQHGAQKIFGVLGREESVELFSLVGVAGVIELVTGALIALGLFTPFAAFIASGQMAAAFFIAHAPRGLWPIENQGEPAVLFCFLFLYLASRDSGDWSLDRIRQVVPLDQEHRNTLYGRQEGDCAGCRVHFRFRNLTFDHIIPRKNGGTHRLSNLQLLCDACNRMKGTSSQKAFLAKLREKGLRAD